MLKNTVLGVLVGAVICFASHVAWADVGQIKIYKSAFPDSKPKCINCHVDEKPKKEDGKHEPNEYGKKLAAAKTGEKPDAETYKAVGPIAN